jgi:hypothetical protein
MRSRAATAAEARTAEMCSSNTWAATSASVKVGRSAAKTRATAAAEMRAATTKMRAAAAATSKMRAATAATKMSAAAATATTEVSASASPSAASSWACVSGAAEKCGQDEDNTSLVDCLVFRHGTLEGICKSLTDERVEIAQR